MTIDDLEMYNLSMDFSDKVWNRVCRWEHFAKDALGKQWVRAADSVDANKSKTGLVKAFRRKLISDK
ncbi:MAG TPA: hypothetical protein DDW85_07290 [Porphyromonadaceae bacterium]|nr:hypothetical protein [Porphyromonadaceae bacterium]